MSEFITRVNDSNFEKEVIQSKLPVLVDFWADWCGPCKKIAPIVASLAEEYQGRVSICKGNMDESGKVMSQYGVSSLPALLVFKDGNLLSKNIGLISKSDIKKYIEEAL